MDVKMSPKDSKIISGRILALCQERPQGIDDKSLQSEMPDVDPAAR